MMALKLRGIKLITGAIVKEQNPASGIEHKEVVGRHEAEGPGRNRRT